MIALLSLLLGTAAGYLLWRQLTPRSLHKHALPAGFIAGLTLQATLIYFLAYLTEVSGLAAFFKVNPLGPANIVGHLPAVALIVYGTWKQQRKARPRFDLRGYLQNATRGAHQRRTRMLVLTLLCAAILGWVLTVYSYRMNGPLLQAGVSVFSDFAPHTAVMRSFAVGHNFPSSYPHFGGDGIAYHFFFYFLCGNLNYLGLGLDWAVNLPSILSMLAFTHLLGSLAVELTRQRHSYWLSPLLVAFRSSFSLWTWISAIRQLSPQALQAYPELAAVPMGSEISLGRAWELIWQGDRFVGTLPRDDWGLFASNVYANQRHFIWGLCLLLILVHLWLPSLKQGLRDTSDGRWLSSAKLFFSKRQWTGLAGKRLLLSLLLLLPFPYWHGSTLIVLLMLLFVMALRSRHKGAYLIMAATAVGASFVLTSFFSGQIAAGIDPGFHWGFLLGTEASLGEVLGYLMTLFGIAFPLMLILPWQQRTAQSSTLSIAALLPLLFALTVSLTADITVNHKFLMLSYTLLTPAIAGFLCRLARGASDKIRAHTPGDLGSQRSLLQGLLAMSLTVLLTGLLTINGVVDLQVYVNKNEQRVALDTESELVHWLQDNTDPEDIFITPPWSYHAFFYSGRLANYGHSYYAWSAGHNTEARLQEQNRWLSGTVPLEEWLPEARARGVRYLIVNDEFRNVSDTAIQAPAIGEDLELMATFPEEGNMLIYRLY